MASLKFGDEETKMLKSYLPEDTQIKFINKGSHHHFAHSLLKRIFQE